MFSAVPGWVTGNLDDPSGVVDGEGLGEDHGRGAWWYRHAPAFARGAHKMRTPHGLSAGTSEHAFRASSA